MTDSTSAGYDDLRIPEDDLVLRRRDALRSWALRLNAEQAEGLRKWVLFGDLTDVADAHRGLVDEWENADRLLVPARLWLFRIAADIQANCPCGHCAAAAGHLRREATQGTGF